MARAIANCTCSTCGQKFSKIAFRSNRTEAESWKKWAEENMVICHVCWMHQQEEAEIESSAGVLEMHYSEYKNLYSDCRTVSGSYDPKTKMIKVIIPKNRKGAPD